MKKKCLIRTTMPVTCFSVPIVGSTELDLTTEEIYKCLCAKAEVQEILSNGKSINLDFTNYNTDNDIKVISVDLGDKETSVEELIIEEETTENEEESSDEEVESEDSLTKTHEMQSRNNVKNKKNKNRR